MEKLSYLKKAFHNFGIFMIFIVVLCILLIPFYTSLQASVKENTRKTFDSKVQQKVKMVENEINIQMNMLKNISGGQDFKTLSNPPAYGFDINSPEWFESREGVRKAYSVLKSIVSMQNRSFMLFRNSDMQIDSNGAVDNLRTSYDTTWRFTSEGEKCSMDYVQLQLFHKIHSGGFENNFTYNDISNGQSYELVYMFTVFSAEEDVADCVFVACYDAERFIEGLDIEKDTSSILITTDDGKKIYNTGALYNPDVYDSCYSSEIAGMKIYYSISDECLNGQMKPVIFFFALGMLMFVLFGFLFTVGFAWIERKNIKRLLTVADGVTDIKYSEDDDHIAYLNTVFYELHKKNKKFSGMLKSLLYTKLVCFRLAEEEKDEIADDFSTPNCIVVIKNNVSEYTNVKYDVESFLKKNGILVLQSLSLNDCEHAFFVKMTNAVKDTVEDMVLSLNKEHHTDIRAVVSICDDINSVASVFENAKKTIQYLEYGNVKFLKDYDEPVEGEDMSSFLSKSRQLYEIMKSGNEFEAKRIVYEQWYKITQGEINSRNIEPLFFSQTSVLLQISAEYKLNVAVPVFDSEKDVVSIAFEITECIELICEKLKGDSGKEDIRSSQIVGYIKQRYTDSSFYMPELVGKFELSDRAIVQMLKKATGDNFSNYLSKLRLAKAQDLLGNTNIPISEVATASGFDSANSLYKAFKKVFGVSPSVYRENRKDTSDVK